MCLPPCRYGTVPESFLIASARDISGEELVVASLTESHGYVFIVPRTHIYQRQVKNYTVQLYILNYT